MTTRKYLVFIQRGAKTYFMTVADADGSDRYSLDQLSQKYNLNVMDSELNNLIIVGSTKLTVQSGAPFDADKLLRDIKVAYPGEFTSHTVAASPIAHSTTTTTSTTTTSTTTSTTTTTTTTTSDLRLKKRLQKLGELAGLGVYTYDLLGKSGRRVGMIAQEVYTMYPDAVIVGGADPATHPWKINYYKLVAQMTGMDAKILQNLIPSFLIA